MKRRHNCEVSEVIAAIGPMKGGVSGGTFASVLNILSQPWKELQEMITLLKSPYCLEPCVLVPLPLSTERHFIGLNKEFNVFTAPWFMASVNTRCVFRSNALLNYSYGRHFNYTEFLAFKKNLSGFFFAMITMVMIPVMLTLLIFPPSQWLLKKCCFKPGEGPTQDQLENGCFRMRVIAKSLVGFLIYIEICIYIYIYI